jgi:hypothetical protein
MKIEALDRDMQPAANKRNIALLQRHMEQALGIPASRGHLRFVPVAEDCAGWKGNTIAGEILDAKDRVQAVTERRGSIRAPRRRSSKVNKSLGISSNPKNPVLNTLDLGVPRNEKQISYIDINRDHFTTERYNYKSTFEWSFRQQAGSRE